MKKKIACVCGGGGGGGGVSLGGHETRGGESPGTRLNSPDLGSCWVLD